MWFPHPALTGPVTYEPSITGPVTYEPSITGSVTYEPSNPHIPARRCWCVAATYNTDACLAGMSRCHHTIALSADLA